MPCVTCGHTMQHLNCAEPLHWCPRCGTVTSGSSLHATYTTQLVERCRQFEPIIKRCPPVIGAEWRRLGIAEAINTPEDQP